MTESLQPVDLGMAEIPGVDDDQRLRTLERDLGRLEGVVESLVASVRMEHETARAARADDRQALNELGERMERAVTGLADEVKKLAQDSAKQDAVIGAKQASTDGALGISRWIFATALTIAMLLTSWLGSKAGSGRLQEVIEPQQCPKSIVPKVVPKA